MTKKNTLNDLNDFLSENPNEIEVEAASIEEFLKSKPTSLVEINELAEKKELKKLNGTSKEEIANYIHALAKSENKSFAEIWLEVLKIGSGQDPLLENTTIIQAIRSLRINSTAVASDAISYLLKKGKR
ncbi:MAG: hypothetical protein HOH13_05500 [Crocinitomicaceae bacterium]|jgi:hypothetical protein|nr:hypothetical protein [Crocinitomicaceae bacterium]MBT5402808.1 hypothetical protein [Crocinitomicaceae bacterium]MBT6029741.1 hypothetical protein [Crocinitomicaceae bacterium]MBT6515539.1 hypothetical protein [Crocinitomicaceae bacterium]MDG2330150.1 hypothetical protein [Flavobacteriales bacterium]